MASSNRYIPFSRFIVAAVGFERGCLGQSLLVGAEEAWQAPFGGLDFAHPLIGAYWWFIWLDIVCFRYPKWTDLNLMDQIADLKSTGGQSFETELENYPPLLDECEPEI